MSVAKQNMIFFRNWPGKFIYMNLIYIYITLCVYTTFITGTVHSSNPIYIIRFLKLSPTHVTSI